MSKIGEISIEKFLSTVDLTLEDYAKGVEMCLQKASHEAGQEAENELHNTSPVGYTGDYRKSWTFGEKSIKRGKSYRTQLVVYNAKRYRLTHLLEKSHRIANKYGSYGKSTPEPHIAPAQQNAEENFIKVFSSELGRIRL